MDDYLPIICTAAALIAVASLAARFRRGRRSSRPKSAEPSIAARISTLLKQRSDYRVFVGVPPQSPRHWRPALGLVGGDIDVAEYGKVPLDAITAFVVADPSGLIVAGELAGLGLPRALIDLERTEFVEEATIVPDDLEAGNRFLRITFGPSDRAPGDPSRYSTTLTNVSDQLIEVWWFGAYRPSSGACELFTLTGREYSSTEFQNWHGLGTSPWIRPGESATDHNNYGSRPILWGYHCLAEGGEFFVAGGLLE